MPEIKIAPYGTWTSPIDTAMLLSGRPLAELRLSGDGVYVAESRAAEGGRTALVRIQGGVATDILPAGFNVRTRVHEYGGGAFTVDGDTVFFSNFSDNRIYRLQPGEAPVALTAEGKMRFADFIVDRGRGRLISVREDHTLSSQEPVNSLVTIDLASGREATLVRGADFYSNPRLSPDGRQLAFLAWNHPNLPWIGCELHVASLDDSGSPVDIRKVAGGDAVSIYQPEWSPGGVLHFASDESGFWNLYAEGEGGSRALTALQADIGKPQWVFGDSAYAFVDATTIVASVTDHAADRLVLLSDGESRTLDTGVCAVSQLQARPDECVFLGGFATQGFAACRLNLADGRIERLRETFDQHIDEGLVSVAEPIEFPTEGGRTAHGFFYEPRNSAFQPPAGEVPPLLVFSHGGPTSHVTPALKLSIQYWTSRGFAVVDVNYGGSTGYGRDYWQRLDGNWGIVDVDDCVNAARHLVSQGRVDGRRTAVRGGSAGGYTTLACLAFRDFFQAGTNLFGVSDIAALAADTHKFEAKYETHLVGPYPERADLYRERSPLFHAENISVPLLTLQGLDDKVVPPNQSEMIVDAVRRRGVPVAYIAFPGEGHGFRGADSVKRAQEAELYFYSRVFGFTLPYPVEPVEIENAETLRPVAAV
ncbi:MAG: S9 family peptidase [Candidatus Dormibacteria bacterium]